MRKDYELFFQFFSFPWKYNPLYPDLFVFTWEMGFAMLRNFGHLITHLHVDLFVYHRTKALTQNIAHYLLKYGSESFIYLSLYRSWWNMFEDCDKKFVNVKTLHVQKFMRSSDDANYMILKKFPNLQTLKLNDNYRVLFNIKFYYPTLKHLCFDEMIDGSKWQGRRFYPPDYREHETMEKYLKEILNWNSHIEKLDVAMREEWNPLVFDWLSENLSKLQQLTLICPKQDFSHLIDKPVLFPNVERFTLLYKYHINHSPMQNIPFLFTKLKHFKLHQSDILNLALIWNFIDKNKQLKSIKLEMGRVTDVEIFRLLEIKQVLLNVEELCIEEIDCMIPADSLMRFLQRNTSLKRISLIIRWQSFIQEFIDLIMAGDFGAKIRKNTIEFTIKRKIDDFPLKYFMRYINIPKKEPWGERVPLKKQTFQCKTERLFELSCEQTPIFVAKPKYLGNKFSYLRLKYLTIK